MDTSNFSDSNKFLKPNFIYENEILTDQTILEDSPKSKKIIYRPPSNLSFKYTFTKNRVENERM